MCRQTDSVNPAGWEGCTKGRGIWTESATPYAGPRRAPLRISVNVGEITAPDTTTRAALVRTREAPRSVQASVPDGVFAEPSEQVVQNLPCLDPPPPAPLDLS